MKRIILSIAAMMLVTSPAMATLIGDSVDIEFIGSLGDNSGVNSHVVGAGPEGNFFGNQTYDFDAFSFSIESSSDFCGIYSCSAPDTITLALSSLDFGAPLTNVILTSNLIGVMVDFGADFVNFTWEEQALTTGTYLGAEFVTGGSTQVSEPGILVLLGVGIAGIGFARRRNRA